MTVKRLKGGMYRASYRGATAIAADRQIAVQVLLNFVFGDYPCS